VGGISLFVFAARRGTQKVGGCHDSDRLDWAVELSSGQI
jgi:hypothetical protein